MERLSFRNFKLKNSSKPLKGINILDIGCGGGLLSEPLSRLGANVIGIDASKKNISIAKYHSKEKVRLCHPFDSLGYSYLGLGKYHKALNYFKKTRILDAGMGQELLARGLVTKGTLWSATSLIDEKFNSLVVDTHLSAIEAGAEVILTNTFTTRRVRMEQNQVGDLFQFANQKACELAIKAKELSVSLFSSVAASS